MSSRSFYSANWYRVANFKPRLRHHTNIHRQTYRGQIWYVLQDRSSGRFHRFTPGAYFVISLMNGGNSVEQIWDQACEHLGDDALTQDEMIRLLAQLHQADVLFGDALPDLHELTERGTKRSRKKKLMSLINPLALRIPIWDPDDFLSATLPLVRPLFSWFGILLFIAVVTYASVLAGMHWSELTQNIVDRVLATENLFVLLFTYPFVKAFHELGHGYLVKHWGGEVHELGVMFLVFIPVPYVDASAATAFKNRYQRALVGAAGIVTELFVAALAMFVWLNAEEGLVRAIAFNMMLIGGISTLLLNGNPLLRFDGYYIFSDLIEIPNLGMRANRYIGYLIQRYLFGVPDAQSPVTQSGERPWFVFYSIASFIYRLIIMTAIVMLVASKFFVVGVLIAIWSVILMLGIPLFKMLAFLFSAPILRRNRGRALGVSALFVLLVSSVLLALPLPYATLAQGVVWSDGEAAIHVGADGQVVELLEQPNRRVQAGTPLIKLEDPLLASRTRILHARVDELELRYADRDFVDLTEAKMIAEQLRHARADLELARAKQNALLIKSPRDGVFIMPRAQDLIGRHLSKGQILGYVIVPDEPLIRVVVPEEEADLVRERLEKVEIRTADRIERVLPAGIVRVVPELSDKLPSFALSKSGGGQFSLDPAQQEQMISLSRFLVIELKPELELNAKEMGGRVHVRLSHGYEPLAGRIYRHVRQVFLKHFNV
ncbi:peptidase M50 [Marinobacterium mangrovicola]|uniref:Putative peptide zinc metalloprotease protein n=1 Tax=Marinobacterium mangrovicola TaxID=1476959 RepID=A0A4R1GK40_9GAMM|nr:peptidase M50 [Marinobacterium mangrovicola]TCK07580.1 putative peptide zinc metalloprotease protein [Marinobacterium mangrovicola]